jgi:hypothetical protein
MLTLLANYLLLMVMLSRVQTLLGPQEHSSLIGTLLQGPSQHEDGVDDIPSDDEQAMQGADRKEQEQDDVGNEVRRRGRPPVGSSRAVNNRDENRRVIADGMHALLGGASPCFTLA